MNWPFNKATDLQIETIHINSTPFTCEMLGSVAQGAPIELDAAIIELMNQNAESTPANSHILASKRHWLYHMPGRTQTLIFFLVSTMCNIVTFLRIGLGRVLD